MSAKNIPQKIGLAFNLKRADQGDQCEEFDEPETIAALETELAKIGPVILLEQDKEFYQKVIHHQPDYIFNIAEGLGVGRGRESQVPAFLETMKIPFLGADSIAIGLTLDKFLTHVMLSQAQVPVPGMFLVKNANELEKLEKIFEKSRYIVKPRWEGSSRGVFLNSLVNNYTDLQARCRMIWQDYQQPAIVEEFISGDEITAGVCGNGQDLEILGMMRISSKKKQQNDFLYSLEVKRDWVASVQYEGSEAIMPEVRERIKLNAVKAFQALELRDFARVDFRVDQQNIPRIIDINPLPGLSPRYSDLPILYKLHGGNYSDLVQKILKVSLQRCGFSF